MRTRTTRLMLTALLGIPVAGSLTGTPVPAAADSAGPYGAELTIDGHGNGHGIGLSQYGALGYAVEHGWSAAQILDHYYGGTSPQVVDPVDLSVRLTALDDAQTAVVQFGGRATTAADPMGRQWGSLVAREVAPSVYRVWGRADIVCPGPGDDLDAIGGWTLVNEAAGPTVDITAAGVGADGAVSDLLAVCEPSGTVRSYRGTLRAVNGSVGENRTVDVVPIEQYLRSVVPSEMPSSWSSLGNGAGQQALVAQAVAARSYSMLQRRYTYAATCDTTACQVYSGAARRSGVGGAPSVIETAATDSAVSASAGLVRVKPDGSIANTMFSASSGGWTAVSASPGFPAVPDAGDAIASNPHHSWTVKVPVATVEQAWPSIGGLLQVIVTRRDGNGDWGGRVLTAVLRGTNGSVTVTGDDIRRALGLRSNWFDVHSPCFGRDEPLIGSAGVTVVGAAYHPTTPVRRADTRAAGPVRAGCTLAVDAGPRPSGAAGVTVTVTTTGATGNGFTSVYPCGTPRPNASAVQVIGGADVPGTTVIPLAADGRVCVFTSVTTHVIVDVLGWWGPEGIPFSGVAPSRLLDTRRPGQTRPAAGSVTRVQVPLVGGVAPSGVSVNLTATGTTAAGFVTVYPCDAPVPDTSVLNVRPGVDVANRALVRVDTAGGLCLWSSVSTHLIVDLDGWFAGTATSTFDLRQPDRMVDTRSGQGGARLQPGEVRRVVLAPGRSAVMFELAAVDAAHAGFVTAWPCGAVPDASVLNASPGRNVANLVLMPTDADGAVCLQASMATDVLVDVVGAA